MRLSVKRVREERLKASSAAAWHKQAQRAASSARVMVLVSLRPAGATKNCFFSVGQ